jgi:hypothetical protein
LGIEFLNLDRVTNLQISIKNDFALILIYNCNVDYYKVKSLIEKFDEYYSSITHRKTFKLEHVLRKYSEFIPVFEFLFSGVPHSDIENVNKNFLKFHNTKV